MHNLLYNVTRLALIILGIHSTVCAPFAYANIVGNDTQNFNPTTSGIDFVTVQSTETLASGLLNFGYFANLAIDTLPDTRDLNGQSLISHDQLIMSDFNIGYGVNSKWDVGINACYLNSQHTNRDSSASGAEFSAIGLNELRANAKYKIQNREPWGMAAIVSMNVNQANNNPFIGYNAAPTFNFEFAVDREIGGTLYGANIGYRLRTTGKAIPGSVYEPVPSEVIASIAASRYVPKIDMKVIGEIYAGELMSNSNGFGSSNVASEAIIGVKYDATPNVSMQAGVGTQVTAGLFTPDFRAYAGINWIYDGIEKKPVAQPETLAPAAKQEISEEEVDSIKNTDFDDLVQKYDFFLRTDISVDPESKAQFEVVRLNGLEFDFGSDKLLPRHEPILQKLLQYMRYKPKVIKIRIEGHTDSVGSEKRNRALSQRRADSVLNYLKKNGIEIERMEAVGYGSSRPIADNGNYQDRQRNRRVEIRVLRYPNPNRRPQR